jgi:peptide subunit release factor 1 (eRF1)
VLTGVQKNLALYRDVADDKEIIYAQIEGNYESESAHDLCKKAWEVVKEKTREERHQALNEIQNAISSHRHASGISEVWRLAHEGRVRHLVCEEGFHASAATDDNNILIEDISDVPQDKVINDAVDEIAATVIEKGGKVTFVDNGLLGSHYKIVGILRY